MQRKVESVSLPSSSNPYGGQRWVVVHDAERDHYELPIALAEAGVLEKFVTDWYTPLDRPLWRVLANSIGKSSRGMVKRFRSQLPSHLTADDKFDFVWGLLMRKLLPPISYARRGGRPYWKPRGQDRE